MNEKASCDFCFRHCAIPEDGRGFCKVRKNVGGAIVSEEYGRLVAASVDPIEKKPLYHFLPGTETFSVAEKGCNIRCAFCQNASISQPEFRPQTEVWTPDDVVHAAKRTGCPSVSFTYSEPLVWQDFLIDTAKLAKKEGLKTVMVSNGTFSEEALGRILPLVDAFNIDLKGDAEFYREICQGEIEPVLNAIGRIRDAGLHIEVTTLIIPGCHTHAMLEGLGKALKERGVKVWHLSRFFPRYRMKDRPQTSEDELDGFVRVAKECGIEHVYRGNSSRPD